jgi:hypothetical protein
MKIQGDIGPVRVIFSNYPQFKTTCPQHLTSEALTVITSKNPSGAVMEQ